MTVHLAWGITGAGQSLSETVAMMKRIKNKRDVKVTTFLSVAAQEVIRMYGFSNDISNISPGGYYEEILTSRNEGASSVAAGRLQLRRYIALIVSPCSANTVAKVAHGISDTLVTNAVANAQKGGAPVLILSTDYGLDESETSLPYVVKRDVCTSCGECIPACRGSAISIVNGKARIALPSCVGCGECLPICPVRAITFMESARTRAREIDAENVKKLKKTKGMYVYKDPVDLENHIMRLVSKA